MEKELEREAALLTVQRTAEILGVSRNTVYDMVEVGQLQVVRPGRSQRKRIVRDSVIRFLNSADPTPAKPEPIAVMPRGFLRGA